MNLILQSRFAWAVILSAIVHGLGLWLIPSPLKLSSQNSKPKQISIVRVVSLPKLKSLETESDVSDQLKNPNENLNLNKDASISEKLAPSLDQRFSVSPLPNQRPLSTLNTDVNLPKIAISESELAKNEEKIELKPKIDISKQESKQIEPQNNSKVDQKVEPNSTSDSKLESKPQQTTSPPTKKAIDTSVPNTNTSGDSATSSLSPPPAFTSTLSRIYQDYGIENLISRQIAPREALINPDRREPGIGWISPNTTTKQAGTVTIVLIVAPDGKVEQELINDDDPAELREIAQQTVKGYYEKFQPIDAKWTGKYRLVTIRFEFP